VPVVAPPLFLPLLAEELGREARAPTAALVAKLALHGVRAVVVPGAPVALEATFEAWARLAAPSDGLTDGELALLEGQIGGPRVLLKLGEAGPRIFADGAPIAYALGDAWPSVAAAPLRLGPTLAYAVWTMALAHEQPSATHRDRALAAFARCMRTPSGRALAH